MNRLHGSDVTAYPVTALCAQLGVTKQAYYKHGDSMLRKHAEEAFVVEYIKGIRRKDPGIGGGKLWSMYGAEFGRDHSVGYNRFYDIIDKYHLKVRTKKRRVRTTDSNHDFPLYPNLTRELLPTRPNQLWVSDITYIPVWLNTITGEYDFCYLSLVTDYYTKEIIGYSVGDTLEAKFPLEALRMALKRVTPDAAEGLIHHSDRGVQYASYAYTDLLRDYHVNISMTESGDPKDNAVAERVNNTIKNELLMGMSFMNIGQVRAAVKAAVDFYNNERPHMSLNGMTPREAYFCRGEIRKKWISYRENHIKAIVM